MAQSAKINFSLKIIQRLHTNPGSYLKINNLLLIRNWIIKNMKPSHRLSLSKIKKLKKYFYLKLNSRQEEKNGFVTNKRFILTFYFRRKSRGYVKVFLMWPNECSAR